jgi:hypothetical protein
MPVSWSTRFHASTMIAIISPEIALRTSGRFMVTISVWPRFSTKACGSVMPLPFSVTPIAQNDNMFYFD